jgi:GNAT superfamily N-acetyltransferase
MFEADPAYFELAHGRLPGPEEVEDLVAALPPDGDRPYRDKFLFTLQADGRPCGVIDLIRGYPEASTWYLGLLYLARERRGRGHGRRLLRALFVWVAAQGGKAVRLAVVEGNAPARWLYATEGFVCRAVREPNAALNRSRRLLVLERPV